MQYSSYRLIVFDWEGTLNDTYGAVIAVLRELVSQAYGIELDGLEIRQNLTLGLSKVIKKFLPQLTVTEQALLMTQVQQQLTLMKHDVYLISGVLPFLKQAREQGILLAIATSKSAQGLQQALKHASLSDYFQTTRSAGETPQKPSPVMLQEIMDECDVRPSDTVMIGDSIVDIEMASFAGIDAIGVDFYGQQSDALRAAGALNVYDDYGVLAHELGVNMLTS